MKQILLIALILPLLMIPSMTRPPDAQALESPFIGEIRLFAGNFAPRGECYSMRIVEPTATSSNKYVDKHTSRGVVAQYRIAGPLAAHIQKAICS